MLYRSINPTTGGLIKEFPLQSDEEVFTALQVADERYCDDWRFRPVAERARFVVRAAQILRERREEYAQLITLEMGKVIGQAYYEVDFTAGILDYYAKHGEAFLAPKDLPDAPRATIVTEPLGVILAIEPWNFPYSQIARVAAPQIVAGNVVMMKQANSVPQAALAFARLFEDAGTPQGVYTNLFCSTDQIAHLIDDFRVRGVTLTGSERAGTAVGERAGRNLKKVVLELGGSDPAIILEDAPLDLVLNQCVPGRMMNNGQACASIKRMIVVGKQRGEEILAGLVQRYAALTIGDPADPKTSIGPVVSESALEGLLAQIDAGVKAGAQLVAGGKRVNRPGFFMEPSILTNITADNPLFQQELFGPVLSYYVVESEEEAVKIANGTKFGLGSSVFSSDIAHAKEIAARVEAGMVFINSYIHSGPEVPFGGVKNSGFGRELSELGIGEFVNRKLIRVAAST
jgi:succinate-semialdehyde dehydrogenase/glutarate-semialdehyde dehydrogenase